MPGKFDLKDRLTREERHEAFWQGRKKKFFLIVGILAVMLQLLFLGNMSYLYGSIWKSASRYHAFEILYVDYDEGVVGRAVWDAFEKLKGPTFPTLVRGTTTQYPHLEDVIDAVKDTTYWAAFTANHDASNNIFLALQGGNAAHNYDPAGALTYVWNEVRYPPFSDEALLANLEILSQTTRLAYNALNGTGALALLNRADAEALQVLLNPIMASAVNIMPTTQGTKLFYNTVSMVMPILQQFFFLLILNGISQELELYSKLPQHISGLVRAGLSVVFDFVSALCMTGYIWGFRESWPVTGNQFALTWMVLWLLMHIHFLILDAATAFLPLPALPFFILTWIIINITSSISPFEVNPGFYRLGYVLPANEAYTVLTDIWSRGNVPRLYRALPILFSWWIAGIGLATYGHFHRCHKAWTQDQEAEKREVTKVSRTEEKSDTNGLAVSQRTASQVLLDAADAYRNAYGPSVRPPISLWQAFAMSEVAQGNRKRPAKYSNETDSRPESSGDEQNES
ncbi:hypothetical protein H2200_008473 [Cladophialophora chaetospira]|uniref:DUF3533 domain-containing protein n=1 Tax=Cladophialophora chaetospira TaxID=386627 RepID=A0AA38X5U6_9EURO|nr:hypothetical protein H2200_008473 [Cladophialophora chaetospira]